MAEPKRCDYCEKPMVWLRWAPESAFGELYQHSFGYPASDSRALRACDDHKERIERPTEARRAR